MPKTKISEFSATPGNNTDIDGINIAEGCAPSGINDAIRELMAQLKDFQAGTAGDSFNGPVGTTTAAAGAFTTLSASSTVSGTGFSTYLASPPAIGGTAAAAGSFTTLTTSSTVTHNGGTANGVAYLNGSKVLTTGSALTFDGTNMGLNTASPGSLGSSIPTLELKGGITSRTGGLRLRSSDNSVDAAYYAASSVLNFGSLSSTELAFLYGGSEQMRLTSTGLGIGTSSPGQKLTVAGTQRIQKEGAGYEAAMLSFSTLTETGAIYRMGMLTGGAFAIGRSDTSTTNLTLDSSGNLGIGTSSLNATYAPKLQVESSASNGTGGVFIGSYMPTLTLADYSASAAYGQIRQDGNNLQFIADVGDAASNSYMTWCMDGPSFEKMRLDVNGNLGIGTSSPGARLTTRAAANSYTAGALQIESLSGTYTSYITNVAGLLLFSNSSTVDQLILDSSGNLGLGVTPSAWFASNNTKAMQLGGGSFVSYLNNQVWLANNYFLNASGQDTYVNNGAAMRLIMDGAYKFQIAPSGTAGNTISFTQAMTLDASGNFLVGTTTSPSGSSKAVFRQAGTSNPDSTWNASAWTLSAVGGEPSLYLSSNIIAATGNAGATQTAKGGIGFRYVSAANPTELDIGIIGTSTVAGPVCFYNDTERARITSGGAFCAGTTSVVTVAGLNGAHSFRTDTNSNWATSFAHGGTTPYGLGLLYVSAAPNGTGNEFLYCYDSAPALRMSVRSNGGIANYSANDVNLSDRREKTNFAPAKSYIDTICAIPVQTFNYIDQSEDDPGLTLGVVAQDVQAVAPELVMESNWGTKEDPKMRLSIYQTDLQYALMKCIQEQQVMINELKAKVAALEAK